MNLQNIDVDSLGPDDKDAFREALLYFESTLRPFWVTSVADTIESATGVPVCDDTRQALLNAFGDISAGPNMMNEVSVDVHNTLAEMLNPFFVGALVGYTRACFEHGLEIPGASVGLEELFQDAELYKHIEAVERVHARGQ